MALTRAQILSGNVNEGVVLLDEPQGVRPGGIGIIIDPDGQIWVNGKDPRLVTLVKTNNDNAYNAYVWPDDIPGGTIDTFLSVDGAGVLKWQTVLPPGTNMVFFQATAPVGWQQLTSATLSDAAIRLVTGAGGGTGGTTGFLTVFSDRTVPLPIHNHPITDPGHNHPYNDPGHNHPISDPSHNHGVNDPGHNHGIADPGHSHGLNDPGHNHGLNDPGHVHGGLINDSGGGGDGPGNPNDANYNRNTLSSTTGININSSTTRVSISGSGTGIGIQNAGARVSNRSSSTGINVNTRTTGITISSNTTGITVNDAGNNDTLDMKVKYANMIVCTKL